MACSGRCGGCRFTPCSCGACACNGCGCKPCNYCRSTSSAPSCCNQSRCRIPFSCSPGWCDQSFIGKKDHRYFNTRCGQCSWAPRYDDAFWNARHGAPVYTTRFDAPSPVKPPWCPPGCKTRSYFCPRFYKRNCDGLYPDECRSKPRCTVRNPTGTNCSGTATNCCRRWSIPLCPCPLAGRSRCFPSPRCCGCAPSPSCVAKRLRCCCDKVECCSCSPSCCFGPRCCSAPCTPPCPCDTYNSCGNNSSTSDAMFDNILNRITNNNSPPNACG